MTKKIISTNRKAFHEYHIFDKYSAGIVLTGGSSLLKGCTELAEGIFGIPVRTGNPMQISGIKEKVCKPQYSTALGLIRYGALNYREPTRESGFVSGFFEKIKNFFAKFFTD